MHIRIVIPKVLLVYAGAFLFYYHLKYNPVVSMQDHEFCYICIVVMSSLGLSHKQGIQVVSVLFPFGQVISASGSRSAIGRAPDS